MTKQEHILELTQSCTRRKARSIRIRINKQFRCAGHKWRVQLKAIRKAQQTGTVYEWFTNSKHNQLVKP